MNYTNAYVNFLKKFLNPQKKLRVVFDCSNGTAGLILKKIFPDYQLLITNYLNDTPDGNFPRHGPDPLKKGALHDLQSAIKKFKTDLGIIFDADADRVFFIDNKGRFINPDAIARLLIWHLKPKKTIIDIRTGWLIKKIQDSRFKIYESRVGHFFIKKLMRKTNADFAAEYSGHYYFKISNSNLRIPSESTNKSELYYDDGILAAIEIINAVSKLPYSLANFIDLLPQYYRSSEINIKIQNDNVKLKNLLKKVEKKFKIQNLKFKIKVSYIDGLTMEFRHPNSALQKRPSELTEGWWFNLRPSNTEPLLRLNMEAENKKLLDKEIKKLYSLIRNFK